MRDFSLRKHTMFWVRLFTAVLFLMLLLLFLWKYRNGLYTDPVLSLRINEVCTINPGTQEGGSTTYEDYIELYNPSDETVSLEGLYLSDDPADPLLSALPADTLGPGQYYLIYAAGEGDSAPADCPRIWRISPISKAATIPLPYLVPMPWACGSSFLPRARPTACVRTGGWTSAAIRTAPPRPRQAISPDSTTFFMTGIWPLPPTTAAKAR